MVSTRGQLSEDKDGSTSSRPRNSVAEPVLLDLSDDERPSPKRVCNSTTPKLHANRNPDNSASTRRLRSSSKSASPLKPCNLDPVPVVGISNPLKEFKTPLGKKFSPPTVKKSDIPPTTATTADSELIRKAIPSPTFSKTPPSISKVISSQSATYIKSTSENSTIVPPAMNLGRPPPIPGLFPKTSNQSSNYWAELQYSGKCLDKVRTENARLEGVIAGLRETQAATHESIFERLRRPSTSTKRPQAAHKCPPTTTKTTTDSEGTCVLLPIALKMIQALRRVNVGVMDGLNQVVNQTNELISKENDAIDKLLKGMCKLQPELSKNLDEAMSEK